MRNWIVRWIASGAALLIVANLHIGITLNFNKNDISTLVLTLVVLGLVNVFIRPIIMFFVWPINCLTFGLLGFVVNVLLFWFVGRGVVPGFHVPTFTAALLGSILMGFFSGVINFLLKDGGDRDG